MSSKKYQAVVTGLEYRSSVDVIPSKIKLWLKCKDFNDIIIVEETLFKNEFLKYQIDDPENFALMKTKLIGKACNILVENSQYFFVDFVE